ncbi:MAG TPA: PAS domain S-box protein [Thermodesulfobacteriota bacterium]|nr:PAS domain S-box protein [Thermodesulfobacteriota bacterium]
MDKEAALKELKRKTKKLEKKLLEQRESEKALKDAEIQYKAIFNAATDGFIIFDLDGHVVEANPQACKMHGYSHSEMVNLSGREIVHPDNHYQFKLFQRDIIQKGEFQAESVDLKKDGSSFTVDVRGTTFYYKGEKHLLAIIRDITERKIFEENLRKSQKDLQNLSSKLLEVQENEKKAIARELHDDLGQTLTAIKLGAENALEELKKGNLHTTASSLNEIIPILQGAIVDIRRVTMDLRPPLLDKEGIVSTLMWSFQKFQALCPKITIQSKITIQENEIPPDLKIVLYRILQEAFNNIVKHSGAKKVYFSLAKRKKQIEFIVRDNGRGFDLKKELSLKMSERGIGLSSMKERTNLSGGEFFMESFPGKGTILRATWPL